MPRDFIGYTGRHARCALSDVAVLCASARSILTLRSEPATNWKDAKHYHTSGYTCIFSGLPGVVSAPKALCCEVSDSISADSEASLLWRNKQLHQAILCKADRWDSR